MTLLALRDGGKRALAAALADLERDPEGKKAQALLDAAWREPKAHVVGVTGPPGVGKSSLCAALVAAWRKAGETVGVIAVDPSSKSSGGALLGDRVRIVHDSTDEGSFVRSMAARDRLGGLADQTLAAMVVMRALFDRVLIETVGVGQSETDVAGVADTVVFCVQPGSGDSLQFMKAGIVEIPHLIVAGQIPSFKLLEDDKTIAFMDINPVNPGHSLSVAKGHWPMVDTIPTDVLSAVAATAQKVAKAVMSELEPHGVNLLQANGPGAGQSVPHLHIHIMPRRPDDGVTLNWEYKAGDKAEIEAIYKRLKAVL
jgi:diadenosine tetraphosphate (Ap4A) HIT family hydrolase/Ni2+-binding GTPase involved in maturation of urease and hydrogenase